MKTHTHFNNYIGSHQYEDTLFNNYIGSHQYEDTLTLIII